MSPDQPAPRDEELTAREADEDLAAVARVLLGREAPPDAATAPPEDEPGEVTGSAEDAAEERRRAAQRQQRLLEELSFLEE